MATHKVLEILGNLVHVKTNWHSVLKLLAKEDVQHLSEKGDDETDGKKSILWIWVVQEAVSNGDAGNEGLQEGGVVS